MLFKLLGIRDCPLTFSRFKFSCSTSFLFLFCFLSLFGFRSTLEGKGNLWRLEILDHQSRKENLACTVHIVVTGVVLNRRASMYRPDAKQMPMGNQKSIQSNH